MDFFHPEALLAVFTIIVADLLLAGDNALLIGMACRGLPPLSKRKALVWGTGGAVVLRVILTSAATLLLRVPFLGLVGGLLLLLVALKLLRPERRGRAVNEVQCLKDAVKTIIVADTVMSLDNVLAVAGAAHGNVYLVVFGLLLSVPILIGGSQLVSLLVERYPVLLFAGAAVLGWTAGKMMVEDGFVQGLLAGSRLAFLPWPVLFPAAVAVLVLAAGWVCSGREKKERAGASSCQALQK